MVATRPHVAMFVWVFWKLLEVGMEHLPVVLRRLAPPAGLAPAAAGGVTGCSGRTARLWGRQPEVWAASECLPRCPGQPAGAAGAGAARGGAQGVQARKPGVSCVALEIPAGFLEWTGASGGSPPCGHHASAPSAHRAAFSASATVGGDPWEHWAALPEHGVTARGSSEPLPPPCPVGGRPCWQRGGRSTGPADCGRVGLGPE